jgi:transcriptional regulator with XRE-family HTH domain
VNAAELIREARRHRIDQRSLAHRSGTSQTHISRIERAEVSPGVETVERLLAVGERLELRAVPGPRGNDSTESNSAPGSGERHLESAWRRPPSSPMP